MSAQVIVGQGDRPALGIVEERIQPIERSDLRTGPARKLYDRLQHAENGLLLCPACAQRRTVGYVDLQDIGRNVWIQCDRGCDTEKILDALHLSPAHLTAEGWPQPCVLTAADLEALPVAPPMLIGEMVRQGSGLLIHGKTSVGKTYLQLELARSLITGEPWFGIAVRPLPPEAAILFLSADWPDAYDFRGRLRAVFGAHASRHRILVMTPTEIHRTEERTRHRLTLDEPSAMLDLIDDAAGSDGRIGALFIEPLDSFRVPPAVGADAGMAAGETMAGVRRLWGRLDLLILCHEERKAGGEGTDAAYGSVKIGNRMPCSLRLTRHVESGYTLVETSKPGRGGHLRFYVRYAAHGSFERVPDEEVPGAGDSHATRTRVIDALRSRPGEAMTYQEIGRTADLGRRVLVEQCGQLLREGLVRRELAGQQRQARFSWVEEEPDGV